MSINLLPQKEKKRVKKLYKARRLKASSWFVIVLIGISTVMLVPMYLLGEDIKFAVASEEDRLRSENVEINTTDIEERVYELNKRARALSVHEHTKVYEHLTDVTQNKRAGISITGMAFDQKDDTEVVRLVGQAINRDILLDFRRDLEQKQYVAAVDLPVSNFAQNIDINFSITVTLQKDNE